MKLIQDFEKDFLFLINRIFHEKKPTYFSRYADGELSLMLGKEIPKYSQAFIEDQWSSPGNKTLIGTDLINSLKNNHPNKIYAISCDCCDPFSKKILLDNLKIAGVNMSNITYANLWINGNYEKFKNIIKNNISEKAILIANEEGINKSYPFELYDFFPIKNDCVNFWENNKAIFLDELKERFYSYKNTLFLISAGPMSELIIDELIKVNDTNRYIDVGSSLDEFTKSRKTRPYMKENQPYYKQMCKF